MPRRKRRRPLLEDFNLLSGYPGFREAESKANDTPGSAPSRYDPPGVAGPSPKESSVPSIRAIESDVPVSAPRSGRSRTSSPSVPPPVEAIDAPLVSAVLDPLGAISDLSEGLSTGLEDLQDTKELDRRTLGNPSLEEIIRAGAEDRLGTNKAGKITTPRTRKASRRLRNPIPGLDPEQTRVLNTILGVGLKSGADYEELLAATETGLVESTLKNYTNQEETDADSLGWRQERTSIYGNGPQGPTNVKASARRFFEELKTDPGAQSAATPGLMAQAAQGSAFPERYDEEEAVAKPLLNTFLKRAKTAKRLGLPLPGVGRVGRTPKAQEEVSGRVPSVVYIGKKAENKFGLDVGENPAFDTVDPVHKEGSFHYQTDPKGRGLAIDVSGEADKLAAFNKWVARKWGGGLAELFYDPGINIDEGQPTEPIGGHDTHVHVAVDAPGSDFTGGYNSGGSAVGSQAAALVASGAPVGQVSEAVKAANEPMPIPLSPIEPPLAVGPILPDSLEEVGESGGAESGPNQGEILLDLLSQAYAGQAGSLPPRRPRRRR